MNPFKKQKPAAGEGNEEYAEKAGGKAFPAKKKGFAKNIGALAMKKKACD